MQLRLLCNMLDGMVAIDGGRQTATGALYNEIPDRIADSILIVALGVAAGAQWLGWLGALGAAVTAYIRVLGGSLGFAQDFGGPLAKPHRMFVMTIGCLGAAAEHALVGTRIYFANHTSHVDTLALWAALPRPLRLRTHPVAAKDYWGSGLRRYLAAATLRAVLIDRKREDKTSDPLEPLLKVLADGGSLILFPEGTRGSGALPGPFKSGLYRLAQAMPHVELVPVYLENLHRSLPRGTFLPIPLTCTVRFGAPLAAVAGETKEAFLARARAEVVKLSGIRE